MPKIMCLNEATKGETLGVTVEKFTERLDIVIDGNTPIAFLRATRWAGTGEVGGPMTEEELADVLEFHAKLKKSQKKGRS